MKFNRRGFLELLGSAATVAVIDPDKLLWKPNSKLISIPQTPKIDLAGIFTGQCFTVEVMYAIDPRTLQKTEHLRLFVLARDVNSTISNKDAASYIYPPMIKFGPYRNVADCGLDRNRRVSLT